MKASVLIVDDDDLLRRSLAFSLEQAGFEARTSRTAEDAIAMAAQKRPDVILLDIVLPKMDGLEALHYFREKLSIPVIFLTARTRGLDQILGLELGAEDYLIKPFDPDILIAHIHAVLRRTKISPAPVQHQEPVQVGELVVDPWSRVVTRSGQAISLTTKEFDLLYALASETGHVLNVDELLNRVWGAEYSGEPQIVYVHMRWLRQKIEPDPQKPIYLITVRGSGYKLVVPS